MKNVCSGCQVEFSDNPVRCNVTGKCYCWYCADYYLVDTKEHGRLDLSLWDDEHIVIDRDGIAFAPKHLTEHVKI